MKKADNRIRSGSVSIGVLAMRQNQRAFDSSKDADDVVEMFSA
ncbi:MAG: hypothetical protein AAF585_26220 [Verrucomicrobiota bacterium]